MKILVLLPRVPYPLEKGDKLRAYNHIRFLSKKNDIILCALNDASIHPDAEEKLKPFCKSIHIITIPRWRIIINLIIAAFRGIPFQTGYFYDRKAQKEIDRIIATEKPDHIFCQLVRVAEYLKKHSIPKTIDYQDVFSMGVKRRMHTSPFYLRPVLKSEYRRLLRYENQVFSWFDHHTIISEPDRDLIPHEERNKIVVVPNGVDTDFFKPIDSVKDYELVFIGNMGYPPNINAAEYLAREILPLVRKTKAGARLLLAGATPDKRVLALKSDGIDITGWVDDIRDCYAHAKIFIAPMQIGTGLQNKLLEAMAMGIPCITSPLANSALGAVNEKEILVGSNPAEFAGHLIRLLDDQDFASKLGDYGYRFVLNNYNWEKATARLENLMLKNQR